MTEEITAIDALILIILGVVLFLGFYIACLLDQRQRFISSPQEINGSAKTIESEKA